MMILYSSGTTGMPKGTPITHNAAIANTQMMMHPDFFHNSHSTGQFFKCNRGAKYRLNISRNLQ